jgi:hypothetical protein
MTMRLLASWRNVSMQMAGRRLSRSAQRIAEFGEGASALGAMAAALCLAVGLTFACIVNEPLSHRIGSAVILGVIPGLAAHMAGRLMRRCLIAASLAFDPLGSALLQLGSRLSRIGIAGALQIGFQARPAASAVSASGAVAWTWMRRSWAMRFKAAA